MSILAIPKSAFPGRWLAVPFVVLCMLALIALPLPPMALDAFFTFNIALSLASLLACVYVMRPLELSVFPTIILITTLFRLALNIASTRVVLLEGHTGTGSAGKVIESFGEFVVGGNYAVGLAVFSILVIINFVVVTKGAGRIAEVSARFVLDGMPGKQMAIDADLNAGIIDQDAARTRRSEIQQEADFYGSMDGASKFVRGDAIAGILILAVNIIGGFSIGIGQHDLSFSEAARNYTLLTIGDGLVAQIPSLLLSSATAILVTRMSGSQNMGDQIFGQVFNNPNSLLVTASIIGVMGLIPGMPNVPFIGLSLVIGALAMYLLKINKLKEQERVRQAEAQQKEPAKKKELGWDDVGPVDMVGLELGYRLVGLVDADKGGDLLDRIKAIRKKLTLKYGFLLPAVHIRDNLDMNPNQYKIMLKGIPVASGDVHHDRMMALNPGNAAPGLEGIATKDPAFGLDALWIKPDAQEDAEEMGYRVIDPTTVVATHVSHVLQSHAHELLGHEESQKILDALAAASPKLAETLVPSAIDLNTLMQVLRNLVKDDVSVRDIKTIAESLTTLSKDNQDISALTSGVRVALSRAIVHGITGGSDHLSVMILDPGLEQLLLTSMQGGADSQMNIEPELANRVGKSLIEGAKQQELAGTPPVVVTHPGLRPKLSGFFGRFVPGIKVLAYEELPADITVEVVAKVGDSA